MASSGDKKREISDEDKSQEEPTDSKRIKTEPNTTAESDDDTVPTEELDSVCINTLVKKDLSSDDEKIVKSALKKLAGLCSVLEVASTLAKKNTMSIIHMGGHYGIVKAMEKYPSEKIQELGLHSLANIAGKADEFTKEGIIAIDGIELALAAMKSYPTNPKLQRCGCIFLGNLSKKSASIAKQVAESPDAVKRVVKAMNAFPTEVAVQDMGCYVLMCICSHKDKEVIRKVIEEGGRVAIAAAADKFPDDEIIQTYARDATKFLWGFRD